MFPVTSEICPCMAVNTAPPSIAIIKPEPPILVSSPKPCTAWPKIVGNIRDIKPDIETSAITATIPLPKITIRVLSKARIAEEESSVPGLKYFI